MVLDTSAIIAILLQEDGYERLLEALDGAGGVFVGAPTLLEAGMVLSSHLGQDARPVLLAFLRRLDAEVIPFGEHHVDAATGAFLRFGRSRHPAGLNFGDCMSYAVAALAGMPLLFTGADFSQTDIQSA